MGKNKYKNSKGKEGTGRPEAGIGLRVEGKSILDFGLDFFATKALKHQENTKNIIF
jgi:hypothetical protein